MWMRMPGQSWPGAEAAFIAMWTGMMVPMMLPSFLPLLWRLRRWPWRAAQVAGGYFAVWTAIGAALFPSGVALAEAAMRWPVVAAAQPFASGIVVLVAGALQFTGWKARHLACLQTLPPGIGDGWRQGLRLGLHCGCGCAGWTAILLAVGLMNVAAMAVVTIALTAERLVPAGGLTARTTGAAALVAGAAMIVLSLRV